ncbi:ribosome-inactivating family protein, partial [Kitasatospora sp. NPDC056327]|uniref:ribosome-inactivating family protein n=1 Tax=Kitasatospora sp. NPDC056327 TaxID=3345785 RepID=UPI0035DD422A
MSPARAAIAPARPFVCGRAVRTLGRTSAYNDATGRALLSAIQIFSEAARFGVVFDVVRGNIQNPGRNRPSRGEKRSSGAAHRHR